MGDTYAVTDNDGNKIADVPHQWGQEPMGTVDIQKSVSLPLPATLNELERFCEVLEQEGVAGITPVRAAPINGHTVRLYVGIEAS